MRLKSRRETQIEKTYLKYELDDKFWLTEPDDDIDKMEYVQFLLNQRYVDERKIADSMKNRTMFFLGIIGVSLTILITVLSGWLTSFGSKNFMEQIWFSSICIVLAFSAICYIHIFYTLSSMDYSERYPVNENSPYLLQKNSLKVTELQHFQNYQMYLKIRYLKQKNLKNQKEFKWGDLCYFIALLICLFGTLSYAQFSPITILFFIMVFIFGLYLLMSFMIMRDINDIMAHIIRKKKLNRKKFNGL